MYIAAHWWHKKTWTANSKNKSKSPCPTFNLDTFCENAFAPGSGQQPTTFSGPHRCGGMTHQCPHCHALLCHGDEELQCSSFRLTPNLKKPPLKKQTPKHTSKQKTTHSQQTRKHTLSSNYKGTLPYLNSFASFLFTGLCNDPFAQHTQTTFPAETSTDILSHTATDKTPEKINLGLYSLNLQLSKRYHLSNLPDPRNQTDAVSLP